MNGHLVLNLCGIFVKNKPEFSLTICTPFPQPLPLYKHTYMHEHVHTPHTARLFKIPFHLILMSMMQNIPGNHSEKLLPKKKKKILEATERGFCHQMLRFTPVSQ